MSPRAKTKTKAKSPALEAATLPAEPQIVDTKVAESTSPKPTPPTLESEEEAVKAFLEHQKRRDGVSHVEAVKASRPKQPKMQPPPAGYFNFMSDRDAGIRVCKSYDGRSVCLQFSNESVPAREEKDLMERVGFPADGREFIFLTDQKIWDRKTPPGWTPSENALDALRVQQELSEGRKQGRGR